MMYVFRIYILLTHSSTLATLSMYSSHVQAQASNLSSSFTAFFRDVHRRRAPLPFNPVSNSFVNDSSLTILSVQRQRQSRAISAQSWPGYYFVSISIHRKSVLSTRRCDLIRITSS